MERIKEFLYKNKSDVINLSILLIFFLICSVLLWGYWGSLYIDNGREAYLPHLILQGKILYKEIFAMYNPLSYQINAGAYAMFGESLNTLYILGTINALLILTGLYSIARIFIKPFYSLAFCILVCGFYIFGSIGPINYVFPYAYAFPYALCGFVYFVLFTLLYLKKENTKYLYPASLALGISLACKFEFSLAYLFFIWLLIYKKESILIIIKNIILFIMPSFLSWGILFLQGFSFGDLGNYFEFGKKFFASPEQVMFSKDNSYPFNLANFLEVCFIFAVSILYIGINVKVINYLINKKNWFLKILSGLFLIILNLTVLKIVFLSGVAVFAWAALASFIIAVTNISSNDKKRFMLAVLAVFGCFSALRFHLLLLGISYSVYMVLIPLLTVYVYCFGFCKPVEKQDYKKIMAASLIFISFINLFLYSYSKYKTYLKIDTDKGVINAVKYQAKPFIKTIDYINKNVEKDDVVVMLPEGPLINFLTNHESNSMYYHLLPNHLTALGEENVLKAFKSNPPDYFLINNSNNIMYGAKYFCEDFGFIICAYIKDEYELVEHFKSNAAENIFFYIDVYKRKTK